MRKYLLHILIISFVFLLAPTAHVALYAGEIEDAKEEVRNNPDEAWAHGLLGIAYGKLGKYKEAIESFKQAIMIDPDDASTHYNLGHAYGMSARHGNESIESYKHAIRIDPDFADAHYNLGVCYIGIRDKSSALRQHKILKKLDTKLAKRLLGMIYTELD